jgi:hypothetical protein
MAASDQWIEIKKGRARVSHRSGTLTYINFESPAAC